ncbi:MAG: LPS assembly lipoprotein LptE [Rubrivivax sp.]
MNSFDARRALLRSAGGACMALVAAGSAGIGLTGCGFRVRQPSKMSFRSIALVGFAPRSTLAAELRTLLAEQVRVVDTPDSAEVVLQALADVRERSVVATTAAAQVRELSLRLRFEFLARTGSGRLLLPPVELMLSRDLNYIESQALAKAFEETELYREMQSDVVLQVISRLAALNP